MKENTTSKEYGFLDEYYRVTKYFGSNLVEIEQLVPNGFWGKSQMIYKRIYFGHIDPIQGAVDFFKSSSPTL
ncbi:MAG: hypothetical protein V4436_02140 [Patescibacteria group bacterium]